MRRDRLRIKNKVERRKIGTDLAQILKKIIVKSKKYAKNADFQQKKNEDCTKRSLETDRKKRKH